jgi:hypothetical protein
MQPRIARAGDELSEPSKLDWWKTDLADDDEGTDEDGGERRASRRCPSWASYRPTATTVRGSKHKARPC